jgi:hypothetical protein
MHVELEGLQHAIGTGWVGKHWESNRGHNVETIRFVGDQVVGQIFLYHNTLHDIQNVTDLIPCNQSSFGLFPAPALVPLLALSLSVEAYAKEALLLIPGRPLFSEP